MPRRPDVLGAERRGRVQRHEGGVRQAEGQRGRRRQGHVLLIARIDSELGKRTPFVLVCFAVCVINDERLFLKLFANAVRSCKFSHM